MSDDLDTNEIEQQAIEPCFTVESLFEKHKIRSWLVEASRVKNHWMQNRMLTETEFLAGIEATKNVASK